MTLTPPAGQAPRLPLRRPLPQDQHQGGREGKGPVEGRGHGLRKRMAVGGSQHHQPPGAGPLLRQQLLTRRRRWTGVCRSIDWWPGRASCWRRWRPGLHLSGLALTGFVVSLGYFLNHGHAHGLVVEVVKL